MDWWTTHANHRSKVLWSGIVCVVWCIYSHPCMLERMTRMRCDCATLTWVWVFLFRPLLLPPLLNHLHRCVLLLSHHHYLVPPLRLVCSVLEPLGQEEMMSYWRVSILLPLQLLTYLHIVQMWNPSLDQLPHSYASPFPSLLPSSHYSQYLNFTRTLLHHIQMLVRESELM